VRNACGRKTKPTKRIIGTNKKKERKKEKKKKIAVKGEKRQIGSRTSERSVILGATVSCGNRNKESTALSPSEKQRKR